MLKEFKLVSVFALIGLVFYASHTAFAIDQSEIQKSIDEKLKVIQNINNQIQETQKNLATTQQKGASLNQEIKNANSLINQLNLSIKSSQVKIEKTQLEIESLNIDINNKENDMAIKRQTIGDLLRQLQTKERESTLMIFLQNKSLADSVFESQSINNLNQGLSDEIKNLEATRIDLAEKLGQTTQKKHTIQNEKTALNNKKSIAEDQKNDQQQLLKDTKNQEKNYQQQIKDLEAKQLEVSKEVEAIEYELRSKINPNLVPIPRPGVLKWPADSSIISQGYGQTSFASKNYRGQWHNGIDIAAPIGTEIYAVEEGVVVNVGNQDKFCPRAAYGKFTVIKHNNGLTTLYGHMSKTITEVGQKVERGQLIGYMGKTGWATGSHLHFTVWSTITYSLQPTRFCGLMPVGGDINPLQYLEAPPVNF